MSKFGNDFGIIVIFLLVIVLSGCSNKYIESSEKELIDRERSVLDAEIVEQDNVGFTLNLKVKDFVEVMDSVNSDVVVQHDNGIRKKRADIKKTLAGCAGLTACWLGVSHIDIPFDEPVYSMWACGAGLGLISLYFIIKEFSGSGSYNKIEPYYIRKSQKCIDSKSLFYGKVKVFVEESDFEKIYYTDEEGNIELKINEIIPEPTKADSMINLIIRYYELVDTMEVRRL
ncbi:hypothetical protein JW879_09960 [candidate division WOR-3 bacterium]|nr:hypothetical protein [candidate division WOR-3 bacterium]